jgi:hypothetical protein
MAQVINKNTASTSALDEKINKIMSMEDENFVENQRFEDRWDKAIPAEKVFDDLLVYTKSLWKK